MEDPTVKLQTARTLNPTTLLSLNEELKEPLHNCLEVIDQVFSGRSDLKGICLPSTDWTLFVDGSSLVTDRKINVAVVTPSEVTEAKLCHQYLSPEGELIALMRVLQLFQCKSTNISTDFRQAFMIVHTLGALWRGRGLLREWWITPKLNMLKKVLELLEVTKNSWEINAVIPE